MDIARQRLARSYLIGSRWTTGRDVVRVLGAVQAQDYDGAKWALSQRTSGANDDAIEREFADGHILRTHVLRPTWHFVDPADIRWMLALTGPFVAKRMATYDRQLGLDDKIFRRSNAAVTKALRDGVHLTRAELKSVLARAKIDPLGVQRTAHLMMRAELDAVICSGPRHGKQFTYALLDERVPAAAPISRDEALLELTRRYFRGRSPATMQDFSWWSGLTMPDVKRGIDLARSELEPATIESRTYWSAGGSIEPPKASAQLLPNYDEFFIGHRDRSALGHRLSSVKSVTGSSWLQAHVVAVDGQLVGGWRRTPTGGTVVLDVKILARLTSAEQERLLNEVHRYAAFVGKPVDVRGLGAKRRIDPR